MEAHWPFLQRPFDAALALAPFRRAYGLGWRRVRALRLLAAQIALTLGLLSPLLCVLHCAMRPDHQPAHLFAHGPGHAHASATTGRTPGSVFHCTTLAQATSSTGPTLPTPRALYELFDGVPMLLACTIVVASIIRPASSGPRTPIFAPPTPPPRLA